jgi:hypothetical protein
VPTWGDLGVEFAEITQQHNEALQDPSGPQPTAGPADLLRRKYLTELADYTGRSTIYYGTAWYENRPMNPQNLSVELGDVRGFMETCSNLETRQLDLILHSPGGNPDAAESIMTYLRQRFDHIRAIVPLSAMSAATMMALACDEIVMGSHSQLGPVDPQLSVQTPEGPRTAPAEAVKGQFEMAKQECAQDPKRITAWMPLLRSLGPGLIAICETAQQRTVEFVDRELAAHMLKGDPDAAAKARAAAQWFADHSFFKSHGRNVTRDDARSQHIKVIDLEDDPQLQDLVLSVSHAAQLTFGTTPCAKLVENHKGRTWAVIDGQMFQIGAMPQPGPVTLGI